MRRLQSDTRRGRNIIRLSSVIVCVLGLRTFIAYALLSLRIARLRTQAKWAANVQSRGARCVLFLKPVGNACERCYVNAIDVQNQNSWSEFVTRCDQVSDVKQRTDDINRRIDNDDPADNYPLSSSQQVLGQVLKSTTQSFSRHRHRPQAA